MIALKILRFAFKLPVVVVLVCVYQVTGCIALGLTRALRLAVDGAWWALNWANRTL